jgi:CHASE3 domain sensor protein
MNRLLNVLISLLGTLLILVVLSIAFGSCTHTKDITTTHTENKSTEEQELINRVKQLEIDTSVYMSKIREMEYLGITFKECPSIDTQALRKLFSNNGCPSSRIDTFIKRIVENKPKTTLKKSADGSLEITSDNISSISQAKQKETEEISQLKKSNEIISEENQKLKKENSEVVTTKDKHSKTKFLSFWWLLVIGICIGLPIGYRFKTQIQSLVKKF